MSTEIQNEILSLMKNFKQEHNMWPTVYWLAKARQISNSSMQGHLLNMYKQGMINFDPGIKRWKA